MSGIFNRLLQGLYLGTIFVLSLEGRATGPPDRVAVSFSLEEASVTLHEPVLLDFSVRNSSTEAIKFDLGFDAKEGFRFSVGVRGGAMVKLPPYSRGGLGVGGKRTIGPGEAYIQPLLFNEVYAFAKSGEYVIAAALVARIQTESGRYLERPGEVLLNLHVGDRDPQRLAQVCEHLTQVATKGGDYRSARAASFALRYVLDPVAVPYLAKVVKDGDSGVRGFAVTGLARIGTREAVEVLESALGATNDPTLRSQINAALWEIKTGTILQVCD
jgi:hypothetical protein